MVVGTFLILQGTGVPAGIQALQVPPGSFVLFTDLNGDGKGEVILLQPNLIAVIDGQTGRFLTLVADVNGDGVRDVLMFNPDGTTKTTDGRTGRVF